METIWKASAPSNIALVKYMGKAVVEQNKAMNASLSMTLSEFATEIEIEKITGGSRTDRWEPLGDFPPISEKAQVRYINFFAALKKKFQVEDGFVLRTRNNFPSDCGLASSASSFAALTKAFFDMAVDERGIVKPDIHTQALVSRGGSGSSCRSFFGPWCVWEENTQKKESIYEIPSKLNNLIDLVVVCNSQVKKVSSSEAHQRVKTSPLYKEREIRAQRNVENAKKALVAGNFQRLAEIAWNELWEMHSMFHTSNPPFFYFAPMTMEILRFCEDFWERRGIGPIATIDAGPNVHMIVREEDKEEIIGRLYDDVYGSYKVIESRA